MAIMLVMHTVQLILPLKFTGILFQENLLLDEDQNLKLIDFGLCAKPKVKLNSILHGIL